MTDESIRIIKTMATTKLYVRSPWLATCTATVQQHDSRGVRLDQTIAYAEAGGQEGDRGFFRLEDGSLVNFVDTQKGPGRVLFASDFSGVHVDVPIYHILEDPAYPILPPGTRVEIHLDTNRRAKLTLSHTASHLLFIAVGKVRPDALESVLGCHIKEDQARFDFSVATRFMPSELSDIAQIARELAAADMPIQIVPHITEPEALFWVCGPHTIPCGGTHLNTTGSVGPLEVTRKNIGKGKERLICTFPQASFPFGSYL